MEIHLNPDQEARLSQIASCAGKGTEELVIDAALRLLEEDAAFRAAARKGMEQADRGEFVSEEEMDARVRRMTGATPRLSRIGREEGTRELVISGLPYIASYRVKDDAVEVLHIFQGAQNRS